MTFGMQKLYGYFHASPMENFCLKYLVGHFSIVQRTFNCNVPVMFAKWKYNKINIPVTFYCNQNKTDFFFYVQGIFNGT